MPKAYTIHGNHDGLMAIATSPAKAVAIAAAYIEQNGDIPAFELFHMAGLTTSRSKARELIRGGGARVNDVVIKNELQLVGLADLKRYTS